MDHIIVRYTQSDINSLVALIDAGLKSLGINSARTAVHHISILENAVAEAKARGSESTTSEEPANEPEQA